MVLLDVKGRVTPEMDKTNIEHSFEVPNGISKIIIDYSYSPKIFENREASLNLIREKLRFYLGDSESERAEDYLPVKNHITLSIDDAQGYRGAAHRHSNELRVELSPEFASPGFSKGTVPGGLWRAMLNVHCCVCNVDYRLIVKGEF